MGGPRRPPMAYAPCLRVDDDFAGVLVSGEVGHRQQAREHFVGVVERWIVQVVLADGRYDRPARVLAHDARLCSASARQRREDDLDLRQRDVYEVPGVGTGGAKAGRRHRGIESSVALLPLGGVGRGRLCDLERLIQLDLVDADLAGVRVFVLQGVAVRVDCGHYAVADGKRTQNAGVRVLVDGKGSAAEERATRSAGATAEWSCGVRSVLGPLLPDEATLAVVEVALLQGTGAVRDTGPGAFVVVDAGGRRTQGATDNLVQRGGAHRYQAIDVVIDGEADWSLFLLDGVLPVAPVGVQAHPLQLELPVVGVDINACGIVQKDTGVGRRGPTEEGVGADAELRAAL